MTTDYAAALQEHIDSLDRQIGDLTRERYRLAQRLLELPVKERAAAHYAGVLAEAQADPDLGGTAA